MSADGSVYAAWLDGFTPGVTFARSADGGRNWTKPIHVDRRLAWSDKPIVAVSDDGKDVYIAFNGPSNGDAYVAVSHDRGDHFGQPVPAEVNRDITSPAAASSRLTARSAFGQTSYNQDSSGQRTCAGDDVDRRWAHLAQRPGRPHGEAAGLRLEGMPEGLLRPPGRDGRRLERQASNPLQRGVARETATQRVYARRSTGRRAQLERAEANLAQSTPTPPFRRRSAGTPVTSGSGTWTTAGGSNDRWNVWFRRSTNGGRDWSRSLRISDASRGTAYIRPDGFSPALRRLRRARDHPGRSDLRRLGARESATRVLGAPGTTEPGRHSQRLRRRFTSGRRAAVQRGLDLRDRLLVVPEVDRPHAEPPGGVEFTSTSSTKRQSDGADPVAQPLDRRARRSRAPAFACRRTRSRR